MKKKIAIRRSEARGQRSALCGLRSALCPLTSALWRVCLLAFAVPCVSLAQGNYARSGAEYGVSGALPGEQVYPSVSVRPSGGYLVWQDNNSDGSGLGISARKLESTLSGALSQFRVNQVAAFDQERPAVSMLNDGGAVFVWQGGKQSYQHIFARFISSAGTWATGDLQVNTRTNVYQLEPAVTTLRGSNVVVVWSTFNQVATNSLRDVYAQILSPTGAKIGGEQLVNQTTAYNQRSAAIAPLSDGRFVVVWISEQQRFENSVDLFARIYSASGVPATGELLINTGTNVCANPSVAASANGGFAVAWMERDFVIRSNSWDVFARPVDGAGVWGTVRRVNTWTYGDQLAPKITATGNDYLVAWTSMGQDGSREGIYGQFLRGDGAPANGEFRVNGSTVSQQIHPALASDGAGRFVAVWTSYTGGSTTFDVFAQRFVNTNAPPTAPGAPYVTALSSNALYVSWPPIQGMGVANYEVYADEAATATATVTNTYWTATGLAPSTTHSYRLAYVLADGQRSPLSGATTNTTYSAAPTWGGIPQEWMIAHFGSDMSQWPSPYADPDHDGASNLDEFRAGTNPMDANSVLRIRAQKTSQGLFLNWNTQPGLMYQVQTTTDLGVWQNLGGPRFAAGSVDAIYVGANPGAFFRIVRLR